MRIDFDLVCSSHIQHIEHHDHRNLHFEKLRGQIKVALEVAGVNDVNDQFGFILQDVITGNAFVLTGSRTRLKGVNAGQVNNCDLSVFISELADNAFNGHARPVADSLMRAGQTVK